MKMIFVKEYIFYDFLQQIFFIFDIQEWFLCKIQNYQDHEGPGRLS